MTVLASCLTIRVSCQARKNNRHVTMTRMTESTKFGSIAVKILIPQRKASKLSHKGLDSISLIAVTRPFYRLFLMNGLLLFSGPL